MSGLSNFFADWIIALGPETFGDDGLYAYAVVTNGNRSQLFVLARDPDEFRADYEDEVRPTSLIVV